jgi:hypothetical protein
MALVNFILLAMQQSSICLYSSTRARRIETVWRFHACQNRITAVLLLIQHLIAVLQFRLTGERLLSVNPMKR